MNLITWLERAGRARRSAPAVHRGEAPWATYGVLASRVARLAAGMRSRMGLAPGDRVAFAMPNSPEYLVGLYAAWWAGLVAVPVNAKLHAKEIAFIAADSGARRVFDSPAAFEGVAAEHEIAPAVVESGALAWLFYTSGTTGRPKGAMLSHRNLAAMTLGYLADVDAVDANGCLLHAAPLSHGSGLYNFTHLLRGASQVLPESGGFDADEVLRLLDFHRGVSMFAAPTIVKRLSETALARGARATGLQTIVYGGGPMYRADLERATQAFGDRLAQIYGQGESPMTITVLSKANHADRGHPRHRERVASVGVPHSVVEVTIRDEERQRLGPGEVGEVCVRGEVVMSGYWNDAPATARALRDGWLWTGDLGCLDDDGFLTLKDRSKDLIVSGGSNIYPREVEEALLLHPAVAEAGVVGAPDAEWGERVVAFVVPRGAPPAVEDLDLICREHIARFKRPREYRFVAQLPKNHYGKVVKGELRAMLTDGAATGLR